MSPFKKSEKLHFCLHLRIVALHKSYWYVSGVNALMASIGSKAKPTVYISIEGDTWTLKTETTLKTASIQFKLGVEFDETTTDDRKMKVRIYSYPTTVIGHPIVSLCLYCF